MEELPLFLQQKRELAQHYAAFFADSDLKFVEQPDYAHSNYWLNAIICPNVQTRERLLTETNENGVMTRPIWKLMHRLPMFANSLRGELSVSEWIESHLVNLPSSPVSLKQED